MKKFVRGSLMASGALILVGIILLTVCASVGGIDLFRETFVNNEFCFGEVNFDDFKDYDDFENGNITWDDNQYPKYLGTQNNIVIGDGSNIEEVNVEIGAATLVIKESTDNQIRLDCEGEDRVSCYVEDEELFLREGNGNDNHNDKISLYLPCGIALDCVEIKLGAGEIIVDTMITDKLSAEAGAGSMTFKNASVRDMELIVGVGKIEFEGIISGDMDARCGIGKINMDISGNQNDWNYDVECAAGKVIIGEDEYGEFVKHINSNHEADNSCDITCALGKVILSFH